MRIRPLFTLSALVLCAFLFSNCNESNSSVNTPSNDSADNKYGGFADQISYGHHLVEVIGCNDCHTPKKMTPQGPAPDNASMLSGHLSSGPIPDIDHKEIESKGLAVTNDMTVWVGPWGTSYAANLTPDETGIGNWTEAQFIRCLREGKSKGLEGARPLLPPMPWQNFASMKDEELKAIFAYLKSIKPINNLVPPPGAPISKHP
jgi:hypothetical protein